MVEARKLCLDCGHCCNGNLFKTVQIEESKWKHFKDLKENKRNETKSVLQRCQHLDDCKLCSIYTVRPKACKEFKCDVLQKVENSEMSIVDAKDLIKQLHKDPTNEELKSHFFDHMAKIQESLPDGVKAIKVLKPKDGNPGVQVIPNPHYDANRPDHIPYEKRTLTFSDGLIFDDDGKAIMMLWEKPIMEIAAKTICAGGGRILNVGFGLGYIDRAIEKEDIEQHTIVESHPDIWAKMKEEGWLDKPNVDCHFGKWQDIMPKLEREGAMFDGCYIDTWDEDDIVFHQNAFRIMKPGGLYSFFNKTRNPSEVMIHPKYMPLHNWYEDPEMTKIELDNVPTKDEQTNNNRGSMYWNPEANFYWHPVWKRKAWV